MTEGLKRLKKNIGRELRAVRKEHGFIQEVVSDYLGISRSVYTQKEIGGSLPTIDQLLKLAVLYKKPICHFVSFHPSSLQHIDNINQLKDENRALKNKISVLEKKLQSEDEGLALTSTIE